RLAWQANRLDPQQVVGPIANALDEVVIWRNPKHDGPLWGVEMAATDYFDGINHNHWWLVATVREQA
ncbi:MAG: hypothetical protein M3487_13260, partial [Actinomycetota bacterium]|nr:hypothetical protein [Actinomycetota bacterium]